MVQIAGKYKLSANENLVPYLTGLGLPEEMAKKADSLTPTMEVTVAGTKYTIASDSGVKNATMAFTLDQEFDDPMPTGDVLKSTATLSGNKIVIKSKTSDGRVGERTYEFTDSQCVLTMTSSANAVVAKRIYNRV